MMADAAQLSGDSARRGRVWTRGPSPDRGAWLRLSAWGLTALGALAFAIYAYTLSGGLKRESAISADLAGELRQSQLMLQQQVQAATRDLQNEARRLGAAVATLNGDRDRLFARVTSLEQSLDSVTGSLSRQAAALASAAATPPPPQIAAIAPQPAEIAAAEPAKTQERAAQPASATENAAPKSAFGIDLGVAPTLDGLRAIWRREAAAPALAGLQPIVVVRDGGTPMGVALHVVAGPVPDAAAAARLCASLGVRQLPCEPVAYEGQRLALEGPAPLPPRKKPRIVRRPQPAPNATPPNAQ